MSDTSTDDFNITLQYINFITRLAPIFMSIMLKLLTFSPIWPPSLANRLIVTRSGHRLHSSPSQKTFSLCCSEQFKLTQFLGVSGLGTGNQFPGVLGLGTGHQFPGVSGLGTRHQFPRVQGSAQGNNSQGLQGWAQGNNSHVFQGRAHGKLTSCMGDFAWLVGPP